MRRGVCLIEWAELIEEILPENVIVVTIEKDLEQGFDYRKITSKACLRPVLCSIIFVIFR
ncbi:MAG: hypothetical protein ACLR2E_12060 [Lachnospiraceae bacterium]